MESKEEKAHGKRLQLTATIYLYGSSIFSQNCDHAEHTEQKNYNKEADYGAGSSFYGC